MIDFQTALQMRDLGFPQPDPEFPQTWFALDSQRLVIFVSSYPKMDGSDLHCIDDKRTIRPYKFKDLVFAPTITDIMRELGHEYDFGFTERPDVDLPPTFWVAGPHKIYLDAEAEKAGADAWIEKKQGIRV